MVLAPGQRDGRMQVPAFTTLKAWLVEIERQALLMRARSQLYDRFDRTARTLTPVRIRVCEDAESLAVLAERLKTARHPGGHALHDLDRVWSRAELGVLITEAVNRSRQLALGRVLPRARGPRFDPRWLPDDRLDHLIQRHPDLDVVEVLRRERRRRDSVRGGHAAG